jgi:salicylate hydroxylase
MNRLRVAVVGAGIAGLAVAAWLRRFGIGCVVYERTRRLGEVGAGIQIGPNASRLLHRLGLADELRAAGVRPAAVELRHWRTGETAARLPLGEFGEAAYGAPYYALHRAAVHGALRRLVDHVDLGRRCVGVVDHGGAAELRFDDATTVTADLVIGADGIRSVIREALARDAPYFSGLTVYRGLIHRAAVEAVVSVWLGPGRHCVWYPIADDRVNVVASVPDIPGGGEGEEWTAPGRVADLVAAYDGWHPDVRRIVSGLDAVTRWSLHERPTLRRLCTTRIAVIGDAAHPMLPFGAQGASQAIEDAAALAICLRDANAADVPAALRQYDALRRPRLARVAAAVGVHKREHHLADGPRQRERDRALGARMSLRGQRWLYGYDVERAAHRSSPRTVRS